MAYSKILIIINKISFKPSSAARVQPRPGTERPINGLARKYVHQTGWHGMIYSRVNLLFQVIVSIAMAFTIRRKLVKKSFLGGRPGFVL